MSKLSQKNHQEWSVERYEAKYHLSQEVAQHVRDWISLWCVQDKASRDRPYVISSLYLDGPRLPLYQDTINQVARRFKLRVRRYENDTTYFEVKRRIKQMIYKSRVQVPSTSWSAFFSDSKVLERSASHLSTQEFDVLSEFIHKSVRTHASPAVVVQYLREAWESQYDTYARVTFDTHLYAHPAQGWSVPLHRSPQECIASQESVPSRPHLNSGHQWTPVDTGGRFSHRRSGVILELKSERTIPRWMSDLTRVFDLRWRGFSKYGSAIEALHISRASIDQHTLNSLELIEK